VLEALGVPLSYPADVAGRLLDQAGFTFLFAPTFHPAMRFAGPVRRELAAPTLFNVVGPLANPAGVRRQVVGVADQHRGPVLAETLGRLGAEHAMVVHGTIGMDEISPVGVTDVWEVRDGVVARWTIDPADHGFGSSGLDRLAGGDPGENAARLERLLAAPAQDPIGRAAAILNAGAALYVAGLTATYEEGVVLGAGALDSGAAARALSRYREAAVNTGA
jgi:anthranilate phosphoribosyltransferase